MFIINIQYLQIFTQFVTKHSNLMPILYRGNKIQQSMRLTAKQFTKKTKPQQSRTQSEPKKVIMVCDLIYCCWQTGRQKHNILNVRSLLHQCICSFVRPSVCYKTCEHNVFKMKKLFLMPIGTSGP